MLKKHLTKVLSVVSIILALVFIYTLHLYISSDSSPKDSNGKQLKDTSMHLSVGVDLNKDGKPDTVTVLDIKPRESEKPTDYTAIYTAIISGLSAIAVAYIAYLTSKKNGGSGTTPAPISLNSAAILNHAIFIRLEDLMIRDIRNLKIGGPGRTEMFRTMIMTQIETYDKLLKEFIAENINFTSAQDTRTKCKRVLIKIINEYESKWKILNIPEPVIERYKELQQDKIRIILEILDNEIVVDRKNENYYGIINSFLTALSGILSTFITLDILSVLRELNGSLKKLKFNGMTLE